MLSIVLLYFIGKAFYDLAGNHNRNKWGMTIAGLATFFGSQVVLGFVMYMFMEVDIEGNLIAMSEVALNFLAIAVGALMTWAFYELLKHNWKNTSTVSDLELLDEDLTE